MKFSSINLLPYSEEVANALGYPVIFVDNYYEPLIESPEEIDYMKIETDMN